MAGSINKVILVGNVGKDPEARSFQNGGKVVNFTMATGESWTDRTSGEKRERTEWHNVVVRNEKLGEIVERYVKKGSKIYVEGSIQSRKYQDQSGADKYITEIVVGPFRGEITLLGGRNDDAGSGDQGYRSGSSQRREPAGATSGGSGGGGQGWDTGRGATDLDDEIPF